MTTGMKDTPINSLYFCIPNVGLNDGVTSTDEKIAAGYFSKGAQLVKDGDSGYWKAATSAGGCTGILESASGTYTAGQTVSVYILPSVKIHGAKKSTLQSENMPYGARGLAKSVGYYGYLQNSYPNLCQTDHVDESARMKWQKVASETFTHNQSLYLICEPSDADYMKLTKTRTTYKTTSTIVGNALGTYAENTTEVVFRPGSGFPISREYMLRSIIQMTRADNFAAVNRKASEGIMTYNQPIYETGMVNDAGEKLYSFRPELAVKYVGSTAHQVEAAKESYTIKTDDGMIDAAAVDRYVEDTANDLYLVPVPTNAFHRVYVNDTDCVPTTTVQVCGSGPTWEEVSIKFPRRILWVQRYVIRTHPTHEEKNVYDYLQAVPTIAFETEAWGVDFYITYSNSFGMKAVGGQNIYTPIACRKDAYDYYAANTPAYVYPGTTSGITGAYLDIPNPPFAENVLPVFAPVSAQNIYQHSGGTYAHIPSITGSQTENQAVWRYMPITIQPENSYAVLHPREYESLSPWIPYRFSGAYSIGSGYNNRFGGYYGNGHNKYWVYTNRRKSLTSDVAGNYYATETLELLRMKRDANGTLTAASKSDFDVLASFSPISTTSYNSSSTATQEEVVSIYQINDDIFANILNNDDHLCRYYLCYTWTDGTNKYYDYDDSTWKTQPTDDVEYLRCITVGYLSGRRVFDDVAGSTYAYYPRIFGTLAALETTLVRSNDIPSPFTALPYTFLAEDFINTASTVTSNVDTVYLKGTYIPISLREKPTWPATDATVNVQRAGQYDYVRFEMENPRPTTMPTDDDVCVWPSNLGAFGTSFFVWGERYRSTQVYIRLHNLTTGCEYVNVGSSHQWNPRLTPYWHQICGNNLYSYTPFPNMTCTFDTTLRDINKISNYTIGTFPSDNRTFFAKIPVDNTRDQTFILQVARVWLCGTTRGSEYYYDTSPRITKTFTITKTGAILTQASEPTATPNVQGTAINTTININVGNGISNTLEG